MRCRSVSDITRRSDCDVKKTSRRAPVSCRCVWSNCSNFNSFQYFFLNLYTSNLNTLLYCMFNLFEKHFSNNDVVEFVTIFWDNPYIIIIKQTYWSFRISLSNTFGDNFFILCYFKLKLTWYMSTIFMYSERNCSCQSGRI